MREPQPISLTLFFPAYNEEANIAQTIERSMKMLSASPYVGDFEMLVIDDGSTDATNAVARKAAESYRNVRVVRHERNMGYGSALKTGFLEASKDWVFFTDADLQFDIADLTSLLVRTEAYDVVVGYRAPRNDPFMRKANAMVWRALNRTLFGLKVRDIDCAFKIFKRALVENLPLLSQGAMINAELLVRLSRKGVSIKEVPVLHLPRVAGSPTGAKPAVIVRALREMVALYGGDLGSVTGKQAMKFMAVGAVNTLLDVVAYLILTRAFGMTEWPALAKFLSFFAGTVSSFILNRSWTFGLRTRTSAGEVARFYASISASLVINVAVMYALVNWLGIYDLAALALTTAATFAANFTLSKLWVFKVSSPKLESKGAALRLQ